VSAPDDVAPVDTTRRRVHDVEAKSTGFRKELGLVDLALTQVLYVVGSGWVGTAAKLGDSHLAFWLLAIALFYLPQAAVVVYLNRLMPLEGGLYQWATAGLGSFAGFLVAWNLWAYTITVIGTFAVIIPTNLSYLLGPAAGFTHASWYTPVVSIAAIVAVTVLAVLGLRTSKWLQNIGGARSSSPTPGWCSCRSSPCAGECSPRTIRSRPAFRRSRR
jgi:amino acid transporter